jgi:microsomal dipeptidase-like Zn-dependent dipeptidase
MKHVIAGLAGLLLFSLNAFAGGTVELHAHLFMKEGMSWMFTGDFEGPLEAKDWHDRFHSQANPETLEKSELNIVVAALYANPLLTSLKPSIRRQLDIGDRFIASHPNWILARNAEQATSALRAGKHVMIYSLEGSSGIIDTDEDVAEFVDKRGIRIITLLHLTDDEFGGVAFLKGFRAMSTPWAFLGQVFHPLYEAGIRLNRNGLTDDGRKMAEKLMNHGVWIDLAHASDASTRELIPLIRARGEPLLVTHTTLRRFLGAERGMADWELEEVKRSAGIVGLMPAVEFLEGTEPLAKGCEGTYLALAEQYRQVASALGPESVMLGSDYNGGVEHLSPACKSQTGLDEKGLWNISLVPEVWKALGNAKAPVPVPLEKMTDRFLSAWARVK